MLPTALLLSLVLGQSQVDYVVLAGMTAEDPYHAAALRIAEHHDAGKVLVFDPAAPEAVLPELRKLQPRYVAIVLRPEQIDINTVRRILKTATRVDPDPFVDFAHGFITGATAEDALEFVDNIVRASWMKQPKKIGEAAVWGGRHPCQAQDGVYQAGKLRFPRRFLRFSARDGKHGRDQQFLDRELHTLEGCDAIIMGGHGMPWEIVSGPRAQDIAELQLFPAVAFNYACHTGVTRTWPDVKYERTAVVRRLHDVEAKRSFALSMLKAGVTGYVAYVNPRPAGPEMSIDFARVLAGSTLGAARRNDYNKVVLGYLGFGEAGIVAPMVEDGERVARGKLDSVRHLMLDGATGGILYGDPAFQPFETTKDALPLRTRVRRKGKTLLVRMFLPSREVYLWGADPFRQWDRKSGQMAMKVYDRIELPQGVQVAAVETASAEWGDRPIETLPPVWAVEEDQGKRYLHVKANFKREQRFGNLKVELVVK